MAKTPQFFVGLPASLAQREAGSTESGLERGAFQNGKNTVQVVASDEWRVAREEFQNGKKTPMFEC
jgi:hypothetical protein